MHARSGFNHNPNTNKAGLLSAANAKRKAKGLPPLTWAQFYGEEPTTPTQPKPQEPPKQARFFQWDRDDRPGQ